MNNKIILENYLLIIKSTIEVYIHGTLESSNQDVREVLHKGLEETLEHQDKIYKELVENNYYVVENTTPSTINKTFNKIKQG